MKIPDTIHLDDLPEDVILKEHYELTDQEQVYSDMFNYKYPEIYDTDIQPILEVEDAYDFYEQYYKPLVIDTSGKDPDRLNLEEVKLLNETDKVQRELMDLADRLEKLNAAMDSLGLTEKYGDRLDLLDATIQGKVLKELNKYMDS
jgi:hypothetical protein